MSCTACIPRCVLMMQDACLRTTDVEISCFWYMNKMILLTRECINSGMEYWNGGMDFLKFNISFYIQITPPLINRIPLESALSIIHLNIIHLTIIHLTIDKIYQCNVLYRNLRGRDQRKKCTLKFIKYTLSRPTASSTTKSALLHRKECCKECFIRSIKHSLWAIKHSCPRALV